ncbi:MAG: alpha/beta fold hydrolase [Holophagales bacterium]|nr:alpha/beta fold hydrolase [Holophagales bacterium]MXX63134.1 alpha/beta fold hydrolase [Holophagales bacterium]MYC08863.1 alpha/beta fold hydrolase [Holophagales bacterium]MYD21006.1 alpha/beta fold hydrolase [Holophagales bacterium]MYI33234.1 alpha/beta fold hydrolase [Holophagales bacterium]
MVTVRIPRIVETALPVAIASALAVVTPLTAQTAEASGHWEGSIEAPTGPLVVMVDLAETDGAWSGTIDIPAQGAVDLPLSDVAVESESVRFTINGVPGEPTFEGTLSGGEITGEFRQGPARLPFKLGRDAVEVEAPSRPQEPKPPFPYDAEEVEYTNGDVKIAGTLTLPPGEGKVPAALLISGSGALNRDLELAGHKPFLVLADHLTRLGIAVLRVDDRGVGGSTGSTWQSTSRDKANDVLTGVRFLRGHDRIHPERVGLIGISEGGLVAPLALNRVEPGTIAYAVLLAGPGVPGGDLLRQQLRRIAAANGAPAQMIEELAALQDRALEIIGSGMPPQEAEAALREVVVEQLAASPETAQLSGEALETAVSAAVESNLSPWFRFFIRYDPRPALGGLAVPTLALFGGKDTQVDANQNQSAMEAALAASGNQDVTIRRFADMNHLFQTARTGSPAEYAQIEETMAPEVLGLIGSWIAERFVD